MDGAASSRMENLLGMIFYTNVDRFGDDMRQAVQHVTQMSRGIRAETEVAASSINRVLNRLNYETQSHMRKFQSIVMGGVAISMSGFGLRRIGRSILDTLGGWITSAEEFNRTVTEIAVKGEISARKYRGELERVKQTIIDIGISSPLSNLEVAEGLREIVQLGYSAKAAFAGAKSEAEKMVRPLTNLVFMSHKEITGEQAAEMMNIMMKSFALGADDADMIVDQLAKTADISALSIKKLEEALKAAAGATQKFPGVKSHEFLGLLAGTAEFVRPRRAGQWVRGFAREITSLLSSAMEVAKDAQKPGSKAYQWFINELGMSDQDLRNADKNIVKFIDDLLDASKGNMAILQNVFHDTGSSVLATFLSLKESGKSLSDMIAQIGDSAGYSEELMRALMRTSSGVRIVFESTKETFQQVFGETFEPVMTTSLGLFQRVLSALTALMTHFPGLTRVVAITTGGLGIMTLAGGSLMMVFGGLMSMVGSLAIGFLQLRDRELDAIRGMIDLSRGTRQPQEAMRALSAMATNSKKDLLILSTTIKNSILPTLAKVGHSLFRFVGLSALFYLAWRQDFLGVRTFVTEMIDGVQDALEGSRKTIKLTGSELTDTLAALGEGSWIDRMHKKFARFQLLWQGFQMALKRYQETGEFRIGQEFFEGSLQAAELVKILTNLINKWEVFHAIVTGFSAGFQSAFRSIGIGLTWIGKIVGPLFKLVWKVFSKFMQLINVWESDPLDPKIDKWERFGKIIGFIAGLIPTLLVTMKGFRMVGSLIKFFMAPFLALFRLFRGGGGAAGGGAVGGGGFWRNMGRRMVRGVGSAGRYVGRAFLRSFTGELSRTTGPARGLWGAMKIPHTSNRLARALMGRTGTVLNPLQRAMRGILGSPKMAGGKKFFDGGFFGKGGTLGRLGGSLGRIGKTVGRVGKFLGPIGMLVAYGADAVEAATADSSAGRGKAIGRLAGSILGGVLGTVLGGPIGGMIGTVVGSVVGEKLGEAVGGAWPTIKEKSAQLFSSIKDAGVAAWQAISETAKSVHEWLSEQGKKGFTWTINLVRGAWETVKELGGRIVSWLVPDATANNGQQDLPSFVTGPPTTPSPFPAMPTFDASNQSMIQSATGGGLVSVRIDKLADEINLGGGSAEDIERVAGELVEVLMEKFLRQTGQRERLANYGS